MNLLNISRWCNKKIAIQALDMVYELFARERKFHPVANTATWHDICGEVTLGRINSINTGIFRHFAQYKVRSRCIGWWKATIKTVLLYYFSDFLKREVKSPVERFSPGFVFIENSPRSSFIRISAWIANAFCQEAPLAPSARLSFAQSVCIQNFLVTTIAAHSPNCCGCHAPNPRLPETRPFTSQNRKVAKLHACYVDRFHWPIMAYRGRP